MSRRLSICDQAKAGIVRQVRALFNDQACGEQPVQRSDNVLFSPDPMIWRVHGDVVSMLVGGVAALSPDAATCGAGWSVGSFQLTDRHARATAANSPLHCRDNYGDCNEAEATIARVRAIHLRIGGTLSDGTAYRADDPALLAWVHVSKAWCFLAAWQQYGNRRLSPSQEDQYYAEFATIVDALGAAPVPRGRAETNEALRAIKPELIVDSRTREIARLVLGQTPSSALAIPVQRLVMKAAVDLLPDWARRMHGLVGSSVSLRPVVRSGVLQMASTLRWAFRRAG